MGEKGFMSKPRRVWFGTLWKPQLGHFSKDGKEYVGCPSYENFKELITVYESSHSGCRWAFAYHEFGHDMPQYEHENCEHIHFCIVQDNAITGNALKKKLGGDGVHLEMVKFSIEHCGRYLLHLTVSSLGKEKIPMSQLFCSGKGDHGVIWFPLLSSHVYETFVPNNVLHYVFNEGMHTLLKFMARFGSCVSHGAYNSAIRQALEIFGRGEIESDFVRQVYDTMTLDQKRKFLSSVTAYNTDKFAERDFDFVWNFVCNDGDMNTRAPWVYRFQQIYIWWKCSEAVMTDELHRVCETYGLTELLALNGKRVQFQETIERNSVFDSDMAEDIASMSANDVEG